MFMDVISTITSSLYKILNLNKQPFLYYISKTSNFFNSTLITTYSPPNFKFLHAINMDTKFKIKLLCFYCLVSVNSF